MDNKFWKHNKNQKLYFLARNIYVFSTCIKFSRCNHIFGGVWKKENRCSNFFGASILFYCLHLHKMRVCDEKVTAAMHAHMPTTLLHMSTQLSCHISKNAIKLLNFPALPWCHVPTFVIWHFRPCSVHRLSIGIIQVLYGGKRRFL